MNFTAVERTRLAALADVLIPPADGCLSASSAGVGAEGLDRFLAASPEAASSLRETLQLTSDQDVFAAVTTLRAQHPGAFGTLCEFAAGAYFLNSDVRAAIGYSGQTAQPIDPNADYLQDGLLDSVILRGPIYRPTDAS